MRANTYLQLPTDLAGQSIKIHVSEKGSDWGFDWDSTVDDSGMILVPIFGSDTPTLREAQANAKAWRDLPYRVQVFLPGTRPDPLISIDKWTSVPVIQFKNVRAKQVGTRVQVTGNILTTAGKPAVGIEVFPGGSTGPRTWTGMWDPKPAVSDKAGRFLVSGIPGEAILLVGVWSCLGYSCLEFRTSPTVLKPVK